MLKLISGEKAVNTGQESKLLLNRFLLLFLTYFNNNTLNFNIFYPVFWNYGLYNFSTTKNFFLKESEFKLDFSYNEGDFITIDLNYHNHKMSKKSLNML